MIGNFRLANKFETLKSKDTYEDVFFDRFNSVHRGFYLVVGQQQLVDMITKNSMVAFTKIPSTERFGSQDIIQLEYHDQELLTPNQKKMIYLLNSCIDTGNYLVIDE